MAHTFVDHDAHAAQVHARHRAMGWGLFTGLVAGFAVFAAVEFATGAAAGAAAATRAAVSAAAELPDPTLRGELPWSGPAVNVEGMYRGSSGEPKRELDWIRNSGKR